MELVDRNDYKYLFDINSPTDLRRLPQSELEEVCDEVRRFLVENITQIGGHFGSGLGVVELTVAMHYVYNTPNDKLIFDVGHQGYPHKILTGRRDRLNTIRKLGGLSGFLKPLESEYDAFGCGHASTSISAALGMAIARDLRHEKYRVVAIIGDGSMTGGMAYEGLNNCGVEKSDITVILNDNAMSIGRNVSAFSDYFNKFYATGTVQKMRNNLWNITHKFSDELGDRLRDAASKIEGGLKSIITPGALFEALGFNYFGPVNGHNVQKLVKMLRFVKDLKGPVMLHVVTHKGKGYEPAERDVHNFHAIGKIDIKTGKSLVKLPSDSAQEYYKVFGKALTELLPLNRGLLAITAAMADGTGLDIFAKQYPERTFDVGIAEEHAVTFAAGLAKQGMRPVVAIYSTFLQRAFDQIAHDVVLQNLPVIFAIDRAGIVGEDGQTHHGIFDLVYMRMMQNMTVTAPKNEIELRNLLYSALMFYKGPFSIRYPRGKSLGMPPMPFKKIEYGTWEVVRHGSDIAILATGKMVRIAEDAAAILREKEISAEVVNCRFIKPLDEKMLRGLAERFPQLITVEDGIVTGGFGSAVLEFLAAENLRNEVKMLGVHDQIVEHGTQDELLSMLGLDAEGIAFSSEKFLSERGNKYDSIDDVRFRGQGNNRI